MKVTAIIQARMGATRLPGKVLLPLQGRSVLEHVVGRVRGASRLAEVCVATTTSPGDDAIVAECARLGVASFRGSEQDVLDRYYQAAKSRSAEAIVRVTADCPLYDPAHLDELLRLFNEANAGAVTVDYFSNCTMHRTFPRGLDTEIFSFAALERAWREAKQPHEREHVTPYLYGHPELFRLRSFEGDTDLSGHRWTLDTPEDWQFVQAVYEALGGGGAAFTTGDVLKLLKERPELAKLNAHVQQKKTGH